MFLSVKEQKYSFKLLQKNEIGLLCMHAQATGVPDKVVEERRAAEVRFFVQSVMNVLFIVNVNIFADVVENYAVTNWGFFLTGIIPWIAGHASNG